MKLGMFIQPMMLPEHGPKIAHEWGIQSARWADEFGFAAVYVGEHHTVAMEPIPAPDILACSIIEATKRIRVGTAGFVLPFYHPAHVANRAAYLDHLSEGRFNLGIAAGSVPTDTQMFGMTDKNQQREMLQESLEMILKLWTAEEPGEWKGKYWTVAWPATWKSDKVKPWLKPVQKPYPPISIAGSTPGSETLQYAGELGLEPMSIFLSQKLVETHWEAYEKGCVKGGHPADRNKWTITREIIVADTDEEAWEIARSGPAVQVYGEYRLPLYKNLNWLENLKHDPSVKDEEIDVDYLLEHHWLVGSPETVARKIENFYNDLGGFGTLMILNQDFSNRPEVWKRTIELMGKDVLPRLAHLTPPTPVEIAA